MNLYKDIFSQQSSSLNQHRKPIKVTQNQERPTESSPANPANNLQKSVKTKTKTNSKQSIIQFKKVFLLYSRLHVMYKLKHSILFLALQLYRQYWKKQIKKSIPQGYLYVICFFLATKYEDIYPPKLEKIFLHIFPSMDQSQYNKYEFKFLKAFGIDMNIQSGLKMIDKLLQNQSNQAHINAYYMLELFYGANIIDEPYNLNEITSSIVYSMLNFNQTLIKINKFNQIPMQTIVQCTKILLILKMKAVQNRSIIFRKYMNERYLYTPAQQLTIKKTQEIKME